MASRKSLKVVAPRIARAATPFSPTPAAAAVLTGGETSETNAILHALVRATRDANAALADDLYNSAVLQQPEIFAAMRGPDASFDLASYDAVYAYQNTLDVPVVVVTRAGNASDDVSAVFMSNAKQPSNDYQMDLGVAVIRPQQTVHVSVKATAYPVHVVLTAVPLRGRAAIFGG
jgi:hypothetical protein